MCIFAAHYQSVIVMSQFEYKPRVADGVLEKKLKSSGAVLVEGPKMVWQDNHLGAACQKYKLHIRPCQSQQEYDFGRDEHKRTS